LFLEESDLGVKEQELKSDFDAEERKGFSNEDLGPKLRQHEYKISQQTEMQQEVQK